MTKKKVVHIKEECISCEACVEVFDKSWKMDEDNMAQLIDGKQVGDNWEREIGPDEDMDKHLEAAENCPVDIIHIKDIEVEED
jgi:ferredoxin